MSGFNQGANNIATALARRPQLQAAADQNAAEMGAVKARTGLLNTQNAAEQFRLENLRNLTAGLLKSGAMTVAPDGTTTISPEAGPLVLSAIAGSSKGGNDSSLAVGNFMKALNAPVESGLDRQNKANIAAASDQVRAARPIVAGSGATVFNRDGTRLATADYTLGQGQNRFSGGNLASGLDAIQLSPNAIPTPATPIATGQPAPPKSSEVQGVLARTIAQITALPPDKMDAKTKLATINAVKSQLGSVDGAASVASSAPAAAIPASIPAVPPPQSHIDYLKSHPEAAGDFDAKYGAGAAAKYLGQ